MATTSDIGDECAKRSSLWTPARFTWRRPIDCDVTLIGLDMVPPHAEPFTRANDVDILALDRALEELATFDPRQCANVRRVVLE